MNMIDSSLAFHGPNMLLAAALYTLLGRYVLSLMFRPESEIVIWRVFKQVTDPFINTARALAPRIVPDQLVMIYAVIWLLFLRMGWFLIAALYGFLPRVAG